MLARLKRRLNLTDSAKDALLGDLIADAQAYVRMYTRRAEVPDGCDGIVTELAAIAYNQMGMEGQSAHSEGGVSISAYGALPPLVKAQLDGLRVARVG